MFNVNTPANLIEFSKLPAGEFFVDTEGDIAIKTMKGGTANAIWICDKDGNSKEGRGLNIPESDLVSPIPQSSITFNL